jgi:hypothetical protein
MQQDPLLERLEWFFTSSTWTLSYPSTFVFPLVKPTSDHVPCVIAIGTKIPRAKIFRFENYSLEHSDFKQVVQNIWNIPVGYSDSAKRINAKFKSLRRGLKFWAKNLPCLKHQIQKTNEVIELLDITEELRSLTIDEWNLRDALKVHIITLLQNQRTYWKQRGKIKWVKLGNENTRFFHTKATINYRHNFISMLKSDDQAEICDHEGKAHILWESFKRRMGQFGIPSMHFNLQDFFGMGMSQEMRESLEVPFTREGIVNVVKDMPNEKSPGPDGFNNEFIKSCWSIVGEDIIQLIQQFFDEFFSLESINSSLITLIPKSESPTSPNDFRPISLLNSVLKIITKILANRLQKIILKLVHKNQYGFLKKRSIKDCLGWAFEYLYQYHKSK